jgi:hypothetical protein
VLVGVGVGVGGSSAGHVFGIARPEVRKKRAGEAKGSNVEAGEVKRSRCNRCRFAASHVSACSCCDGSCAP